MLLIWPAVINSLPRVQVTGDGNLTIDTNPPQLSRAGNPHPGSEEAGHPLLTLCPEDRQLPHP